MSGHTPWREIKHKRDALRGHLEAVLADDGNCTADEPQDPSCPRCKARAALAELTRLSEKVEGGYR